MYDWIIVTVLDSVNIIHEYSVNNKKQSRPKWNKNIMFCASFWKSPSPQIGLADLMSRTILPMLTCSFSDVSINFKR